MKRKKTAWELARRRVTWKVVAVFTAFAVLVWWARPTALSVAAGGALIAAGEALRLWAAGHLQKNEQVTTTGPYAHVKNPLYLGSLIIMAGFSLMAWSWWLLAAGLAVFWAYYVPYKNQRERDRLRERFGQEWIEYDQAVPDYLPRFTAYGRRGTARWRPELVIENTEHRTAIAVAVGVILIGVRWWTLAP
ncbi:MAG: isoprenylcysteine carboxylmethyltransferase family protein [Nitrospirota bacterium]